MNLNIKEKIHGINSLYILDILKMVNILNILMRNLKRFLVKVFAVIQGVFDLQMRVFGLKY